MKKQKKTVKNKSQYNSANYNEDVVKVVKIIAAVILFFGIIYLITALVTGELNFGKKEEKETKTTIQYEEILAGQTLNRNNDSYYVILYNFSSDNAPIISSLKTTYKAKTDALGVYTVDLDKAFNTPYITTESYKQLPTTIEDFKIKCPTIVKVKQKQ